MKITPDENAEPIRRILFLGATKNFFKIGYYAIHYLSRHFKGQIKIRLAVPNIEDAKPSCKGAEVEFYQWNPDKPESLREAYQGCTASMLVPPIHNRIEIVKRYLRYAQEFKLSYLICIGV